MTRVRKLDANKDMTFGHSLNDFYIDKIELVAQNIDTALRLILGEWFLDTTQGTDWGGKILGHQSKASYDGELQRVILNVEGVTSLAYYDSDLQDRSLSVTVQVNTTYTTDIITLAINLATKYAGNTWPQIGISYTIGQSIIL